MMRLPSCPPTPTDGVPATACPPTIRRAIVGSYVIFYRINETAGSLLAYHVRYAGRRPLSAGSHRRMAAEGEHHNRLLPEDY
jgi:hypothetical protein